MNLSKSRLARTFGLVGLTMLASFFAGAATVYKLVDRHGKVTYAETPPIGFDGKVTTMTIDASVNPASLPPAAKAEKPEEWTPAKEFEGYLEKRRATRAALEARLERARERLEKAKEALANVSMDEDEFQVVMKESASSNPPKPQAVQAFENAARNQAACARVVRMGRAVQACGTVVANEKFMLKVAMLELDVRNAEKELSEAEHAYRRGVD